MGKRVFEDDVEKESKRPRVEAQPETTFQSAKQMQQALVFHQDTVGDFVKGIKSFKTFLESILYAEERSATGRQQNILKDFLDSQPPAQSSENDLFLSSFPQAWSYASQMNNERLVSSVSAIIALLLKTISTLIEFRDHGIRLCRLMLREEQVKHLAQSLNAQKHKDYVISPSLRILTEIISFDGGSQAELLFAVRTSLLDPRNLARNLSLRREDDGEAAARKKPAVRDNAVRYLLANLRFQSASNLIEILKSSPIFRSLFEHMKSDSSNQIVDILTTFQTRVVEVKKIPRASVGYVLADQNLLSIAALLRPEQTEDDVTSPARSSEAAYRFLVGVCTAPSAGIIRSSTGWYPVGSDIDQDPAADHLTSGFVGGLGDIDWFNKFTDHVPVRNLHLAKFVRELRPHSNVLEAKLCVELFEAVPELVANYFMQKTGFLFDPKLSATWIGMASTLFSILSIPVAAFFGLRHGYVRVPPPTSVVMENLLPQPLSQKVLIKCLNQQHSIITFFAVRILTVALQKLATCLEMYRQAERENGQLWAEGRVVLIAAFTQRLPTVKDLLAVGQKLGEENQLEKEALHRLLRLYFDVTPQLAVNSKLDVSSMLVDAIAAQKASVSSTADETTLDLRLALLDVSHLFQVARWSSDTNWWSKSGKLTQSPCGSVIKMILAQERDTLSADMSSLMHHMFATNGILQSETQPTASIALIESLRRVESGKVTDSFLETLDDLSVRILRRQIKYEDDLDTLRAESIGDKPISMIWLVLAEQWSFIAERPEASAFAEWTSVVATACSIIGEDEDVIRKVLAQTLATTHPDSYKRAFSSPIRSALEHALTSPIPIPAPTPTNGTTSRLQPTATPSIFNPPTEEIYHPALHTALQNMTDTLTSSNLPYLLLNLSSTDTDIRTLSLRNITTLSRHLSTSTHTDAKQLYLLTGILSNTVSGTITTTPAPWTLTTYAASAFSILTNPLHPLYDKIARFHTSAPKFDAQRLPSYWIGKILREVPSSYNAPYLDHADHSMRSHATATMAGSDGGDDELRLVAIDRPFVSDHFNEVHFLLHWIYATLRTPVDLEILRARSSLEPIMNLVNDVYLPDRLKEIVFKIAWRITAIEGGSSMLITRRGIVSWIEGLLAHEKTVKKGGAAGQRMRLQDSVNLKALLARIWETCDRERMMEWSHGALEADVKRLLGHA